MKKNPMTLSPDTPFEEALKMGKIRKSAPFRLWKTEIVGIATESDIVRF